MYDDKLVMTYDYKDGTESITLQVIQVAMSCAIVDHNAWLVCLLIDNTDHIRKPILNDTGCCTSFFWKTAPSMRHYNTAV